MKIYSKDKQRYMTDLGRNNKTGEYESGIFENKLVQYSEKAIQDMKDYGDYDGRTEKMMFVKIFVGSRDEVYSKYHEFNPDLDDEFGENWRP